MPTPRPQSPNRLTPEDLADGFTDCARALWCVATGVMGRREGAEDVLQESAIVAMTKIETFEPGTSLLAWLSQIVRFTALNHARKARRAPTLQLVDAEPAARAPATATPTSADGMLHADQEAFDDDVSAALGELDETARACLLMRVTLDLPYRDIALALDIPEGTAMSHVHRSRTFLRTRLSAPATEVSP